MGVTSTINPVHDDWLVDDRLWAHLREKLPQLVSDWHKERPLEAGPPVEVVRQVLCLPDRSLVHALVSPPLTIQAGRVVRVGQQAALPAPISRALEKIRAELKANPFAAPATERLTQLGLGPRELGAAVRAGALVRIADGVVLLPGSIQDAATMLGALPQPFTVSQARQALGTTRRVTVPLLEILDRKGLTLRLPDDRRRIRR